MTVTNPTTYKDLAKALQELSIDPNQHLNEEIIYQHEGVRLYFLSPVGEVLTTYEPQLLKISLVEGRLLRLFVIFYYIYLYFRW